MHIQQIKSLWYHNYMPEYHKDNLVYLQTATDTTNGREASYVGVVYDDVKNSCIIAYTAYGKITASHQFKHMPSIQYRDAAKRKEAITVLVNRIDSQLSLKTDKNYVMQDLKTTGITQTPAQQRAAKQPAKRDMSIDKWMRIPNVGGDFPERVEHSYDAHDEILKAPHYIWERHPNRMRMMYIVLFQDMIAFYNISGGLTGDMKYGEKHDMSFEMMEDIGEGLVFTGHKDPVGNIVIHRYLRQLGDTTHKGYTWAQQKSITTYFFNTLYNKNEDIYDRNLPIYLNDYVTGEQDARAMIADKDHGYATNVMFHDPHSPIGLLNYLER